MTDSQLPGDLPPAFAPPAYAPPAYPPPPVASPQVPVVPGRRSRKGLWWTLGIVGAAFLLLGCCAVTSLAALGAGSGKLAQGDSVAVIYINGEISGVSGAGLSGGSVTPETIISQLKRAQDDPAVKAIVLRIDSPGGTASASEEIAIEVARCTKPTIASIGDVGASGAYMIASQCDEIMSTNSSAVGSIGVIMEIGDYSELAKKLGVKYVAIHEGTFKDAGSPWRGLTTTETAMLQADVKLTYDNFIAIVAKGRRMSDSSVRGLATGWAWPGIKAKSLGLVDRIGNYTDAVKRAGKLGKIEGEPNVVTYTDQSLGSLLQQVTGLVDRLGAIGATAPALRPSTPTIR
jgi:protease-4